MTPKEFADIRRLVLTDIDDAAERKRIKAISYPQVLLNLCRDQPILGWPESVSIEERELIMKTEQYRRFHHVQTIH